MKEILARAALIPLDKVQYIQGLEKVLDFYTVAISLKEEYPTHLFVVGETLPISFAASIVYHQAHLFYGPRKSYFLAEDPSFSREKAIEKPFTLAFKGGEIFNIAMQKKENLRNFFSLYWKDKISTMPEKIHLCREIKLVDTTDCKPTTALLISKQHCHDLEQTLYSFPMHRFAGVRFAICKTNLFIIANTSKPLEGMYGVPFYAIQTSTAKLFLPCGKKMEPSFAIHFFSKLIKCNQEDVCIWQCDKQIEIFPPETFRPLNCREWRAVNIFGSKVKETKEF